MKDKLCNKCGVANSQDAKYCQQCGYEIPINTSLKHSETEKNATNTKANSLKTKLAPVIGALVGFIIVFFIFNKLSSSDSLDKTMTKIANEINKNCPLVVDEHTQLDNTVAMPNNIFKYNYTLVNLEKGSFDEKQLKATIEPNIVNIIKTNPDMEYQRKHKTTLVYNYKDKNGVFLFDITVTPKEYQ